jgi:outer membrane protein
MRKIFIAALAFLAFVGCKENQKGTEVEQNAAEVVAEGDLAFVNVDYVLAESDIFKSEGIALRDKTEKTQQKWMKKEQNLQNEMQQLAEKYQKGLITTADAQKQQTAIEKKITNYQTSAQKEAESLDEENFVFTNRTQDLVLRAIQAINAEKKYKMVINSSALLDADPALDISDAVLAKVNELYAAEKNEKK